MVILWDTIVVLRDPSLVLVLKTLLIMFYIFHGIKDKPFLKNQNEKLPRIDKILLGCMFQSPTGSQNQVHLVKLELYSIR